MEKASFGCGKEWYHFQLELMVSKLATMELVESTEVVSCCLILLIILYAQDM